MNELGMHHINSKRKTKKKAKKMAKKMARKYLQDELKKKGYIIRQNKETKLQKFMNKAIFFIALVGPILTLPQIRTIWIDRHVDGLSIYTWGAYVFTNACWLFYAIIHKERTLIFNYILRSIVNLAVFIGIIIYS